MKSVRPHLHVSSDFERGFAKLTVNDNVGDSIDEVFLVLGLPIIRTKLSAPVTKNGVCLGEHLSTKLNERNVRSWICLRYLVGALDLWPFIKSVSNVFICGTSVLTNHKHSS